MIFNAQPDEGFARIGYGGGSGICDEGDVGSCEKLVDKFPTFLVLIELVVACRGGMNVEMPEEMTAGAIKSTSFRMRNTRRVMSSRFPMGVAQR